MRVRVHCGAGNVRWEPEVEQTHRGMTNSMMLKEAAGMCWAGDSEGTVKEEKKQFQQD